MGRRMAALAAVCTVACGVAATSASAARVVNGDFERGNLSGWDKQFYPDAVCGKWFANRGPYDPEILRARGDFQLPRQPQGKYAAIADQPDCPSGQILSQVVKLKPGRKHQLRFKLAYLNVFGAARGDVAEGGFLTPPSLGLAVLPNQQFRVDVMKPGAPIRSVKGKHVLKRVYRTNTGDPQKRNYRNVKANLTRFAGRKVRVRFAVVVNQAPLITGIDAVKIKTKRKKR